MTIGAFGRSVLARLLAHVAELDPRPYPSGPHARVGVETGLPPLAIALGHALLPLADGQNPPAAL